MAVNLQKINADCWSDKWAHLMYKCKILCEWEHIDVDCIDPLGFKTWFKSASLLTANKLKHFVNANFMSKVQRHSSAWVDHARPF